MGVGVGVGDTNRTGGPGDKVGGHHNRAFVMGPAKKSKDVEAATNTGPSKIIGIQLHHNYRQLKQANAAPGQVR